MSTNNKRKWLGTLATLLVALISVNLVTAQDAISLKLYAVGIDWETRDGHIWEIDHSAGTARIIFSLANINMSTPVQVFSEDELNALNAAIEEGSFLRTTADTPGIVQTIQGIWPLTKDTILLQTSSEICNSPMLGCFGYYEFLALDIQMGGVNSLIKVDYHSHVFESRFGCTRIGIGSVLPNPTQSKFAFTIEPLHGCQGSQAFFVDYSSSPVGIQELAQAEGLSWSPDGVNLAYYVHEDCRTNACTASIQVITPPNTMPMVLYRQPIYYLAPLFTSWIDNRTVIFQWPVSQIGVPGDSEAPNVIFWHDIIDGSEGIVPLKVQFQPNGVYFLKNGDESSLFGLLYPDSNLGIGFAARKEPDTTPIINTSSIRGIYYNSRFPNYLLVSQDDFGSGAFLLVDAGLNQSPLDFSGWFPADEIIYDVAIGAS